MPKLCMIRIINLSNTQFRYQLVFFTHIYMVIYGWLKVAFGIFCLGSGMFSFTYLTIFSTAVSVTAVLIQSACGNQQLHMVLKIQTAF